MTTWSCIPPTMSREEMLFEREGDLLTKAVIGLQRVETFGVPVDRNPYFSLETSESVGMVQTPDLDFTDGKAPFLDERALLLFPPCDLRLVREIEPSRAQYLPSDREASAETD